MISVTVWEEPNYTLTHHRTDRFKAGLLSFSVCRPIGRREAMLSSLLLPVLFRGCEKYPTVQALNRRLDYLFGTDISPKNYYSGQAQVLGMSFDLLEQNLLPADAEDLLRESAELMREIFTRPLLDEDGYLTEAYVESEKRLLIDHIRARRNQPAGYAYTRAIELMFRGEPRGVPITGTEEEVASVTKEELTAFWKGFVADFYPEVFYVGSLGPERVTRVISDAMRDFPIPTARRKIPVLPDLLYPDRPVQRVEESLPIEQGRLVIGFRCGTLLSDRDYHACGAFNEIFGNLPTARLFLNVREKMGLCYSCSSSYNPTSGTVMVTCGLQNENRERAEREIFHQLQLLAAGDTTEEELDAAKAAILSAVRQIGDSPSSVESFFLRRKIAGVPCSVEEYRKAIERITREDVTRVAQKLVPDVVFFLRGDKREREEATDGIHS